MAVYYLLLRERQQRKEDKLDSTVQIVITLCRADSLKRWLVENFYAVMKLLIYFPEELPATSNHKDRWKLLQNIKRGFWKKWSSDFLFSLQPRKKWQDAQPNLKEEDIVLIKGEGPPGTWPMVRVLQVHPGNDGLVRVATVKTKDSVFKRPVHKLHKLPTYPN
ncbi:integrase catalytic domain-containing protein [Trichonephila clavipes]|nr:integrase catalytic domain-containing protein [Trichonephila clavipes]